MTKDEFKTQSSQLFFQVKESMCEKITTDSKAIFEKASQEATAADATLYIQQHLMVLISLTAFEASCDYSEKLSLLLLDHFSR